MLFGVTGGRGREPPHRVRLEASARWGLGPREVWARVHDADVTAPEGPISVTGSRPPARDRAPPGWCFSTYKNTETRRMHGGPQRVSPCPSVSPRLGGEATRITPEPHVGRCGCSPRRTPRHGGCTEPHVGRRGCSPRRTPRHGGCTEDRSESLRAPLCLRVSVVKRQPHRSRRGLPPGGPKLVAVVAHHGEHRDTEDRSESLRAPLCLRVSVVKRQPRRWCGGASQRVRRPSGSSRSRLRGRRRRPCWCWTSCRLRRARRPSGPSRSGTCSTRSRGSAR